MFLIVIFFFYKNHKFFPNNLHHLHQYNYVLKNTKKNARWMSEFFFFFFLSWILIIFDLVNNMAVIILRKFL